MRTDTEYYTLLNHYLDRIDCWGDSNSSYSNTYYDFLPTGPGYIDLVLAYYKSLLLSDKDTYLTSPQILMRDIYAWLLKVGRSKEMVARRLTTTDIIDNIHTSINAVAWINITKDFEKLCDEKEIEMTQEKEINRIKAKLPLRATGEEIKEYVTQILKEYGIVK